MPQQRIYRTEGIVLREQDYGEADRILTLLTPSGKLSVLAKGIRRATSHKVGHLGMFYRAQLLLARGRNLQIVSQAESLEEFEGIRHDLLRFTYACYAGELMDRFTQEEEECPELYELMGDGLRWFAQEQDLRLWLHFYELRLLSYAGYQPQLFSCVACHAPIQPEANAFSAAEGGLVCPRCLPEYPQARLVSLNAQKVLRYLMTHASGELRALTLLEATHNEVEALLQGYVEYVLEREVRSVAFLRQLRREIREGERASRG